MAFCPSGGACPGGHSNRCALYSRCDVLDSRPEHAGYTTYKFAYKEFASGPCDPSHYLAHASGTRSSLEACATTCKGTSECGFMAFCPSGGACPGGHSNRCALYSRCDVLDSRPAHAGYTTYKLAQEPGSYTEFASGPCYPSHYLARASGTRSSLEPSAPAGGHAQEGIATGVRSTVAAMCWTRDQNMPATPLTSLPRSQAATKSSRQDLAVLRIIWHMLRERDQVLRLVPQRARVPQSA